MKSLVMDTSFLNKKTIPFASLLLMFILSACSYDTDNNQSSGSSVDSQITADSVLTNGRFYTSNPDQPWAEAVAIKDGAYLYVGSSEQANRFAGEGTKLIELANKMVMPGINDAHTHPVRGGIKRLYECNFGFTATPDEIAAAVEKCVADNPDADWIRGGQWDSGFFDNYPIASPREFLDAVSGDKAVILNDDSNHNGWANTKALKLAGITADTPDPSDGSYVRNPKTGIPNGILLEGAEQVLFDQLPDWSDEQYIEGAREAIRIAHSFGITGLKDANSQPQMLEAFKTLDGRGEFKVHMATSLTTPYGHRDDVLDYDQIDALRDQYASKHVHTKHVKFYADGVPTSSRTAAMLAPYVPATPGAEPVSGMLHLDQGLLTADLIELDKRGYTVKIHVAGDRAVRVALDAIEATRKANGNSGLRHELAHAGYIDKADIPRFAELGAVADLSPYLWHPSPIIDSIVKAVGSPRGDEYWPIKDLLEANAPVLAGSDWPAAVESIDPWVGIEAMVTRADPRDKFPGVFWPEQAISLEQALKIYTIDGARAMTLGDTTGSIETGKSADMIVLNHNLFEVAASAIGETKVEATYFEGELVYPLDPNHSDRLR